MQRSVPQIMPIESWILVDRGASGVLAATDDCDIFKTRFTVDAIDIDNHHVKMLMLILLEAFWRPQRVPVIAIVHP